DKACWRASRSSGLAYRGGQCGGAPSATQRPEETVGFDAAVRPEPSAEGACSPRRSRRPRHVVAPAAVLAGRMHAALTPTLRPTEHLVGLQVAFDELEHAARGLSGRIAV